MDQNSNVNLKMAQGDFPMKYSPKTLKHPWSISQKTLGHFKMTILKYNEKSIFWLLFRYWQKIFKKNLSRNMDILISNRLSESILDFAKWSNWKYANTHIGVFSIWPLPKVQNWLQKQIWNENVHNSILNFWFEEFWPIFKKVKKKMDFPLYFKTVILKWPKVF